METKVTKKDLIGDLKNFPIEVVEKMLQKQYKQVNKKDITVFQTYKCSGKEYGGFRWEDTIEGLDFWSDVICQENFDRFFNIYPKLSKKVYIHGDDKLYENVIKTLERRGGINDRDYFGNGDCFYYIDPITNLIEICMPDEKLYNVITSTFEKIEPDEFVIEMTLPEIAEKLGIDVKLLRIKK